ncbi:MAG: ATP-binding cassette domain-containing protein [Myxococcales bacterium]|nr:ATP-binding cassette domain-containing protein [Myxococcales bacterium]MBL8722165.1 ATP-binding cassette domain-containing protein [Myxococcales bacterium]
MISIEHVSKSFGHPVLKDVSFQVPDGCLYGLVGPGASGKSVLLKCIVGLLRPDEGNILVDGEDVTKLDDMQLQKLRLKFGMLFQNNALFDYLPVAENIAFPLRRLYDLPEEEIASRVAERLARMALSGFEQRAVGGLSGGQKKRIGVARATVTRAPIILYDEPAAGLDPVTSQKIFNLLREEQRASNATVVMVSSDVDRLLTVTDRVGMMLRGQLIFDGTTDEVKASAIPAVKQFIYGLDEGPL